DRGRDAVARELALVAQEAHDALEIRLERTDVEPVRHRGREVDAADLVERRRIAPRGAGLVRHSLQSPRPLHQLPRPPRADASYPFVEVGADEDGEIDQPLAIDPPRGEEPLELDRFGDDRTERALAGQELFP